MDTNIMPPEGRKGQAPAPPSTCKLRGNMHISGCPHEPATTPGETRDQQPRPHTTQGCGLRVRAEGSNAQPRVGDAILSTPACGAIWPELERSRKGEHMHISSVSIHQVQARSERARAGRGPVGCAGGIACGLYVDILVRIVY
eukprot:7328168-Prymnesium_polylepis.1